MGYRLAQYGQDLLVDLDDLRRLRAEVRGKGFKGATGTSASYAQLLADRGYSQEDVEGIMHGNRIRLLNEIWS